MNLTPVSLWIGALIAGNDAAVLRLVVGNVAIACGLGARDQRGHKPDKQNQIAHWTALSDMTHRDDEVSEPDPVIPQTPLSRRYDFPRMRPCSFIPIELPRG